MESKSQAKNDSSSSLISGGLIAVGLVILQSFLSIKDLDNVELVSVFAFAIAIPILSYKILVNFVRMQRAQKSYQQRTRHSVDTRTPYLEALVFVGGILAALVGTAAAFLHMCWIAALIFSSCTLICGFFYLLEARK